MKMKNPFKPSFGVSPHILAQRETIVEAFNLGLAEGVGSPGRVVLISGIRGMGKTVLLNELEDTAKAQGWVVLRAYPGESMITDLIDTTIPDVLIHQLGTTPEKRRLIGASMAALGSVSTQITDIIKPIPSLITRLRELADRLAEQGSGVFLTIDEIQSADSEHLRVLATALQDLMRDGYEIACAAAGLPYGVQQLLSHEGTTFLRRAMPIELTSISGSQTAKAIEATIVEAGKRIEPDALQLATTMTHGYPYLIQLVGSLVWAKSTLRNDDKIIRADVSEVAQEVKSRMFMQVHAPALREIPEKELELLYAIAQVMRDQGVSIVRIGDVAKLMNVETKALSVRREKLINRELIAAPKYGHVEFTLPYLGDYLLNPQ